MAPEPVVGGSVDVLSMDSLGDFLSLEGLRNGIDATGMGNLKGGFGTAAYVAGGVARNDVLAGPPLSEMLHTYGDFMMDLCEVGVGP